MLTPAAGASARQERIDCAVLVDGAPGHCDVRTDARLRRATGRGARHALDMRHAIASSTAARSVMRFRIRRASCAVSARSRPPGNTECRASIAADTGRGARFRCVEREAAPYLEGDASVWAGHDRRQDRAARAARSAYIARDTVSWETPACTARPAAGYTGGPRGERFAVSNRRPAVVEGVGELRVHDRRHSGRRVARDQVGAGFTVDSPVDTEPISSTATTQLIDIFRSRPGMENH